MCSSNIKEKKENIEFRENTVVCYISYDLKKAILCVLFSLYHTVLDKPIDILNEYLFFHFFIYSEMNFFHHLFADSISYFVATTMMNINFQVKCTKEGSLAVMHRHHAKYINKSLYESR